MADRLLDSPWSRVLLALGAGTVLAGILGLFGYLLPPEPGLRFLGGTAATSASLGTAFVFTGPMLAQHEPLRTLARRAAQAGSGWLMALAGAGTGYLAGHLFPQQVTFLALTSVLLGCLALYDTLRLLAGIARAADGRGAGRP